VLEFGLKRSLLHFCHLDCPPFGIAKRRQPVWLASILIWSPRGDAPVSLR
jgi:hypothetical protein